MQYQNGIRDNNIINNNNNKNNNNHNIINDHSPSHLSELFNQCYGLDKSITELRNIIDTISNSLADALDEAFLPHVANNTDSKTVNVNKNISNNINGNMNTNSIAGYDGDGINKATHRPFFMDHDYHDYLIRQQQKNSSTMMKSSMNSSSSSSYLADMMPGDDRG